MNADQPNKLIGYRRCADGLFRRRHTFTTNKPGVVSVRVLVRDSAGRLVRTEFRQDSIRLAAFNIASSGKTNSLSSVINPTK